MDKKTLALALGSAAVGTSIGVLIGLAWREEAEQQIVTLQRSVGESRGDFLQASEREVCAHAHAHARCEHARCEHAHAH